MALTYEVALQKHATLNEMAPQVVAELDKIDESMRRIREIIRPNTSLNRGGDKMPALSREFEEYKACLHYEREKLCRMLEQDLMFWTEQLARTQIIKERLEKKK